MKTRTKILVLLLGVALLAPACGAKPAPAEPAAAEETVSDTDSVSTDASNAGADAENASDAESEPLPAYTYPGSEPYVGAVCDYLVNDTAKMFEASDVSIPCVIVIDTDDSNPDDILVWGDFWIYQYTLNGDTLKNDSGGAFPGLMHLKKEADGSVKATSLQVVADGENFTESAKEIFGDRYDAYMEISADTEAREEERRAMIADYVKANGLSITQYQDYGWDPVKL